MMIKNWYNSKGDVFYENELVVYLSVKKSGVVFLNGPSMCGKSSIIKQVKGIVESDISIVTEEYMVKLLIDSIRSGSSVYDTLSKNNGGTTLAIEDIDLLLGKEATQTEIGYIIQNLVKEGKMIVFTGINMAERIPVLIKMLKDVTVDYFDYL